MTMQQRELLPMLKNIIGVTKDDRKNSQWYIGYPVSARYTKPRIGGS